VRICIAHRKEGSIQGIERGKKEGEERRLKGRERQAKIERKIVRKRVGEQKIMRKKWKFEEKRKLKGQKKECEERS